MITAVYNGNASVAGSVSTTLSQVVSQVSTTTALSASVNPAVAGQKVKLTATVAAVALGAGTAPGSVTFYEGATILGSVGLSGSKANLTLGLSVGSHTIAAVYSGGANFSGSTSADLVVVVSQAATSTTLTSSLNPSSFGKKVTFTAKLAAVAPGTGTPTGSVTFYDGTTTLGTATLVSGTATFATTTLARGSHTITAV